MLAIGITSGHGGWPLLSHGLPYFPGLGGRGIGSAPLSFLALPPCQKRWFGACALHVCAGRASLRGKYGVVVCLCMGCLLGSACGMWVACHMHSPFPTLVVGTLYTCATIGFCQFVGLRML